MLKTNSNSHKIINVTDYIKGVITLKTLIHIKYQDKLLIITLKFPIFS